MPSAEETSYLIEMVPIGETGVAQESFTSRDVDALVSRIKENLRLSGLKSRSSLAAASKSLRASPYKMPWELCGGPSSTAPAQDGQPPQQLQHHHHDHNHHHHHHHHQQQHGRRRIRGVSCKLQQMRMDNSYEGFQALLHSGALINEAVKRLRCCSQLEPPDAELSDSCCSQPSLDDDDDDDVDNDDVEDIRHQGYLERGCGHKRFYLEDEETLFNQPLEL